MDWTELKQKCAESYKKYRYVMLILLAGLFLMLLPTGDDKTESVLPPSDIAVPEQEDLQDSLGRILSKIDGAGRVEVLLTEAAGQQFHYQTDEDLSTGENSSDIRRETVVITDSSRAEAGLVRQIDPPVYLGAIVLCQGADSPAVRLAIVEAVSNATGLSSNKISVLKMKA